MSHPFGKQEPALRPEDMSDATKLAGVIDRLVTAGRTYWRHTRGILRLQLRHQELASEDAFVAYLDLEEAINARANWMLVTVARWAFEQGRRCGSGGGERSGGEGQEGEG